MLQKTSLSTRTEAVSSVFGSEAVLNEIKEEAAFGAALYASVVCGVSDIAQAKKRIAYGRAQNSGRKTGDGTDI